MTTRFHIFKPKPEASLSGTDFGAQLRNTLVDLGDLHTLITGGTRRGKSGILELICRGLIARGVEGVSIIDPHGSFARALIDWLAHPFSGQHTRVVHMLGPQHSAGLNPLRPHDDSWEAAHDAAIVLTSVVESRFEASPEETPRLSRVIYVAGMLCARHGLTLLELVELLSIGSEELRRSLLADFDNRVVRRELEDLCILATKRPHEFLAIVESAKNRFVKWLGDPRLARMLGQTKGLDLRAVMDNRELVVADFSALNYSDAALMGCIYSSMAFAIARRRPPLQCARHRLILDEAESLITLDVARMCDQSAKVGLNIIAAIQRLGQLRARGDFVADALLTNCGIKICFGGLEPESARYMAEALFTGHIDLQEWKSDSARPTAVGNKKIILKNRSRAEHQAHSESHADTDMRSWARASAAMSASMSASGATFGSGDSLSFATTPTPLLSAPEILGRSVGHNNARHASTSAGLSSGRSRARQFARGRARTDAHATSDARSSAEGESEAFVTRYETLPTQMYSLEEQLHRLTGELINLPRREVFVKVESKEPFRATTADLTPAFRSAEFRAEVLPKFLEAAARRSHARPLAEVDREIAERVVQVAPAGADEPDFGAPQPIATGEGVSRSAEELRHWLQSADAVDRPRPHLRLVDPDGGDKQ